MREVDLLIKLTLFKSLSPLDLNKTSKFILPLAFPLHAAIASHAKDKGLDSKVFFF